MSARAWHHRTRAAAVLAVMLAAGMTSAASAGAQARGHPVRDWNVSADGTSSVTTASGGSVTAGDTLVAYVEADAAGAGSQTATVSGCGQSWQLLARQNAQNGDTETWSVTGAAAQSSCTVTATLGNSGYKMSLTAADYTGAGTPTGTTGHAASGAAAVTVSSIPSGSALWMAGNDWDNAISRTLLSGDALVHQNLPSVGDTYWVENQAAAAGGTQTIGTSAPAGDQWNAVAVVIPPASQPQPPAAPTGLTVTGTTSSTVSLSWTAPSGTVTGYYVYRGGTRVATVTSGTSYTDTGLTASTTYTYTVSAFNGAGEGPQSSSVQATTGAAGSCPNGTANTPGGPDPWGGCWPGPGNTGVPAGTTLTQVPQQVTSGTGWAWNATDQALYITSCGVTLTGLQVNGEVALRTGNGTTSPSTPCATITNSVMGYVNVDTSWPCNISMCGPLVLRHDELNQSWPGFPNIGYTNFFGYNLDIHNGGAVAHCNGICVVQDSYAHGGFLDGQYHYNAIGSSGDGNGPMTVEHDWMSCGDFAAQGTPSGSAGCSADLGLYGDFATIANVTVDHSFFAPAVTAWPSQYEPPYCFNTNNPQTGKPFPQATNEVVTNNVFGRGYSGVCGTTGPVSTWTTGNGNVWSGNTWSDGTALNEP